MRQATLSSGPFLPCCLWDPCHLQGPHSVLGTPPLSSKSYVLFLFILSRLYMCWDCFACVI